jgi:hypothetical protein
MAAAAAALQLQDRNTDWVDELERVAAAFNSLPTAARLAVLRTLDAFEAEDVILSERALRVRRMLGATLAEAGTGADLPGFGETLHRLALVARFAVMLAT